MLQSSGAGPERRQLPDFPLLVLAGHAVVEHAGRHQVARCLHDGQFGLDLAQLDLRAYVLGRALGEFRAELAGFLDRIPEVFAQAGDRVLEFAAGRAERVPAGESSTARQVVGSSPRRWNTRSCAA